MPASLRGCDVEGACVGVCNDMPASLRDCDVEGAGVGVCNDMPASLRDCDVEGACVGVCGSKLPPGHFADDDVGIATAVMRRLEGYMDDAYRKFNVEYKATLIMCFNVSKKELASLY